MSRKCSVWVVALGWLSLWTASTGAAEPMFAEGGFQPYVELPPSQEPATRGLERRVLFFVHFTCPFCRGIHPTLSQWAKSLPAGMRYEVIPAVGLPSHAPMAVAYYAVLEAAPEKLEAFVQRLYVMLQDEHRSAESAETYLAAAVAIGIPRDAFIRATQDASVRRFALRAKALTVAYGLNEVPSVVIGNRYLTSPRRVQNQEEAFVAVMNGLVSMLYAPATQAGTR
jgi:protein dithiol oxidoreductase (disulfide-forming)